MAASDRLYAMDALRGLAAITVVIFHAPFMTAPIVLPSGYLAVDLFFMLSGFVIARNYDPRRAAGMTVAEFIIRRLIRFWPLFALGAALGGLIAMGVVVTGMGPDFWTWRLLLLSGPAAIFMLPSPVNGAVYPTNPVGWSLLFELIVNIAYFALSGRLRKLRYLVMIILVSGVAMCALAIRHGDLDMGWLWSQFASGLARATFGFFSGVLIHRLVEKHNFRLELTPWIPIAVCLTAFALPRELLNPFKDLAFAILVCPVVLLSVISTNVNPRYVAVFSFLGTTSYAIYTMHQPLLRIASNVLKRLLDVPPETVAPWAGIAFLVAVVTTCWLLEKYFDRPMRAWLNGLRKPGVRFATP